MAALQSYEWALLAAVILGIFEALTGTFVALGFAAGCLAVALAEFLGDGLSLYRDAALFVVCAAVVAVTLRRVFAHHGDSRPAQGDVNQY